MSAWSGNGAGASPGPPRQRNSRFVSTSLPLEEGVQFFERDLTALPEALGERAEALALASASVLLGPLRGRKRRLR